MNIYSHHQGRRVVTLDAQSKRLGPDFPGWGVERDEYLPHLLPITAGTGGTIVSVDSHGMAPYTRYYVRLDDGSRIVGAVLGDEIAWADGSTDQARYGTVR